MEKVKRTKTPQQALQSLMHLCAKSEKSTGDARRALHRWGIAPEEHDAIIGRLTEMKFIDDQRYAEAYVREKTELSGWGPYKIRSALRAKQIGEETVVRALGLIDRERTDGRLEEKLRRKMNSVTARNGYELKNKLLRYGTSLGYDFEQVCGIIDRLVETE